MNLSKTIIPDGVFERMTIEDLNKLIGKCKEELGRRNANNSS